MADSIFKIKEARINEEYLVSQVETVRAASYWRDHKDRIATFDKVYAGNLKGLTADGDNDLQDIPYIENTLKNATHDITRLAKEATGVARFTKEGEDQKSELRAKVRGTITETIWKEGGGLSLEGKMFLDAIAGGFMAACVYYREGDDYPMFLRLNPRFAFPTVANGRLKDMVYVESMKERQAATLFPDLGLDDSPKNSKNVDLIMVFTDQEVVQGVVHGEGDQKSANVTSRWEHGLGRVPVAFQALDTADDQFRGLFDQLSGPMLGRNKAIRLMLDYLEDMAHSPYEESGILNSGTPPSATTVYHHDPNFEGTSFMKRVQPGAPAGAVFGLLNYLDAQEATEGIQPPARVGTVTQSIASGSFVASTQGALSSVVLELQTEASMFREDLNKLALMIDEAFLDFEKPLLRAVGKKTTYSPKKDIDGWYYHRVMYGAAAGLDRRESDQRVLAHLGARMISRQMARNEIDYIENDTNVAESVDQDILEDVMFQKLVQDPNTTFADLAAIDVLLGDGKTVQEAIKEVLPQLLERQQQQLNAAAGGPGAPQNPADLAAQGAEGAAAGGAAPPVEVPSQIALPPAEQIQVRG